MRWWTARRVLFALAACVVSITTGCERHGSHREPRLTGSPVQRLDGGADYDVQVTGDGAPAGVRWSGRFAGSPLAPMDRVPVILKADDAGGPIDARWARFIESVERAGGVASLGVITSRIPDDDEVPATYRRLHERGWELWLHGHTHDWSLPEAEFAGVDAGAQRAALEHGLRIGHERLGVAFRTFGAPGNAIDEGTVTALREVGTFRVWLYGREGAGVLVLPRRLEIEANVGVVREAEDFLAALDADEAGPDEPRVLQVHPGSFDGPSAERLDAILAGIAARGRYRFTTPEAWWCWLADRDDVVLSQVTEGSFRLDLRSARCAHRLEWAAPARITRATGWSQEGDSNP